MDAAHQREALRRIEELKKALEDSRDAERKAQAELEKRERAEFEFKKEARQGKVEWLRQFVDRAELPLPKEDGNINEA